MYHIANENTENVIFETMRVSISRIEKDHGHKEFTDTTTAFHALLGSALGKLAMHMLLNTKTGISYQSVHRIVHFRRQNSSPAKNGDRQELFSSCCPSRGHLNQLHQNRFVRRWGIFSGRHWAIPPTTFSKTDATDRYERCPVTASIRFLEAEREMELPSAPGERSTRTLFESCG